MTIYLVIIAAVIILGMIMPQQGEGKKAYIVLMAVLHTFVCGFRYRYIHGDLRKYAWTYMDMVNHGWTSDFVLSKGRNTGFYLLNKFIAEITDGNFQMLLIVIAIITEVIVAVLIYKYSPMPWLSYLVWNCLGFYTLGFFAIKQALAMAVLMWAAIYIFESKPKKFFLAVAIAGFIHMPAISFLPAYWIAKRKVSYNTIIIYIVTCLAIFVFKNSIVNFITSIYYEEEEFTYSGSVGGRFFLIVLFILAGILIKGFDEKKFEMLFNLIIIAAIFQMFSGYDNIFTRWSDYYLQFTVLYIPMLFYKSNGEIEKSGMKALMGFNKKSNGFIVLLVVIFLVWFYYTTNIGVGNGTVDDYTNFRFMWQVSDGM